MFIDLGARRREKLKLFRAFHGAKRKKGTQQNREKKVQVGLKEVRLGLICTIGEFRIRCSRGGGREGDVADTKRVRLERKVGFN